MGNDNCLAFAVPAALMFIALCKFEVRIHSIFWAGDVGTAQDFLYAKMQVTKVTFWTNDAHPKLWKINKMLLPVIFAPSGRN